MANPFSGIINSTVKQLYINAIDSLLYDDSCTRPCRIIYTGSKFVDCPNCAFDPIGRKSSNRFQSGGPMPFPQGSICPMCGGAGKRQDVSQTELIDLMVIWDSNAWVRLGGGGETASRSAHTPNQLAQTISRVETWAKLNRANEIILDTEVEGYKQLKYTRVGDPELVGIGSSQYVIAMWERNG